MPTPEQIGKYSITGVAGKGNMAVVYVGHDPFTDDWWKDPDEGDR